MMYDELLSPEPRTCDYVTSYLVKDPNPEKNNERMYFTKYPKVIMQYLVICFSACFYVLPRLAAVPELG